MEEGQASADGPRFMSLLFAEPPTSKDMTQAAFQLLGDLIHTQIFGIHIRSLDEMRTHLLGQKLQRSHHHLPRDVAPGIQLGENPVYSQFIAQLQQPICGPLRAAYHDLVPQHLVV